MSHREMAPVRRMQFAVRMSAARAPKQHHVGDFYVGSVRNGSSMLSANEDFMASVTDSVEMITSDELVYMCNVIRYSGHVGSTVAGLSTGIAGRRLWRSL